MFFFSLNWGSLSYQTGIIKYSCFGSPHSFVNRFFKFHFQSSVNLSGHVYTIDDMKEKSQ